MENKTKTTRYVIFSKALGTFFRATNSRSLHYNEKDFQAEDVNNAQRYKSKRIASEKAVQFYKGFPDLNIKLFAADVTYELGEEISVTEIDAENNQKTRDYVAQIEAMSLEEKDELPKYEWIKFKKARRYVKDLDEIERQQQELQLTR